MVIFFSLPNLDEERLFGHFFPDSHLAEAIPCVEHVGARSARFSVIAKSKQEATEKLIASICEAEIK